MLHKKAVLSSDGRGCHPGQGRGRGETRPYFLQCGAAGGSSLGRGGLLGSQSGQSQDTQTQPNLKFHFLETANFMWWRNHFGASFGDLQVPYHMYTDRCLGA